jgi:hypothetical protein
VVREVFRILLAAETAQVVSRWGGDDTMMLWVFGAGGALLLLPVLVMLLVLELRYPTRRNYGTVDRAGARSAAPAMAAAGGEQPKLPAQVQSPEQFKPRFRARRAAVRSYRSTALPK